MSRPDILDDKCGVCGKTVGAAPFYDGVTVEGVEYCDPCLKKNHLSVYLLKRKGKTAEDFAEQSRKIEQDKKARMAEEEEMLKRLGIR